MPGPTHAATDPPQSQRRQEDTAPQRSNVTRLLCAGVHLDPRFRRAVLDELIDNDHRFVAPSYGYDVVTVLEHAVLARRRHHLRSLALLAGLVPLVCTAITSALLSLTFLLLTLWWAWLVVFLDELVRRYTLLYELKRHTFTGHVPKHPLERDRAEKIRHDQSEPVLYYSGFVPFVGAGKLERSWSFSTILKSATGDTPPDLKAGELYEKLAVQLKETLEDRPTEDEETIHNLRVVPQRYSTALRTDRPTSTPTETGSPPTPPASQYDAPRQYILIAVESWEHELVTSIFIGVDIKNSTLHTELHSYQLLPIKASFHEVDRLPTTLSIAHLVDIAVRSPFDAMSRLFRATADLVRPLLGRGEDTSAGRSKRRGLAAGAGLTSLITVMLTVANVPALQASATAIATLSVGTIAAVARWVTAFRKRNRYPVQEDTRSGISGESGKITDWGARISIRDLAASDQTHHFFQDVDQDKYTKLIERRVMDTIITLLKTHKLDVREYRTRQTAILNLEITKSGLGRPT
ncbi:hypothetical protein [Actinophytocola sp.]|uniref:hypothetical protein n=1 Tax=Actinophytocola sp. TaxID=1872138 RepID=UPI003899BA9A